SAAQPLVLEGAEASEIGKSADFPARIEPERTRAIEPERPPRRGIEVPLHDLAHVRVERGPSRGDRFSWWRAHFALLRIVHGPVVYGANASRHCEASVTAPGALRRSLSTTEMLICFVAALGFAFDTYELLMLP